MSKKKIGLDVDEITFPITSAIANEVAEYLQVVYVRAGKAEIEGNKQRLLSGFGSTSIRRHK
jgi:hypothetical protein